MTAINPQAVRGPVTAVPVVAGHGVRLREDVENNRVVAEADETVLYEVTTGNAPTTSATLTEAASNFERLRIFFGLDNSVVSSSHPNIHLVNDLYMRSGFTSYELGATLYNIGSGNPLQIIGAELSISGTSITVANAMRRWYNANAGDTMKPFIYKVIGINRVSASA